MERDNIVHLLVGQRGSGKTHYAKRLIEKQPEFSIVSRDEILIRIFGSVHTCPYTGGVYVAQELMDRLLRRKLSTKTGLRIILDCWTGSSKERKALIQKLREFGASRVVALYFVTPLETVNSWFWQKPGIAKFSEMRTKKAQKLSFFSDDAPANDFEIFHKFASRIDSDGFDEVIRVNPKEEVTSLVNLCGRA